jgi:hypothetical protein
LGYQADHYDEVAAIALLREHKILLDLKAATHVQRHALRDVQIRAVAQGRPRGRLLGHRRAPQHGKTSQATTHHTGRNRSRPQDLALVRRRAAAEVDEVELAQPDSPFAG